IADKHGVAVLIIHHTGKSEREDIFDTVSGTLGLTGAADAVLILQRARKCVEGKLSITGRDVLEEEYRVKFSPEYGAWKLQANNPNDPDDGLSPEQKQVRQAIRDAGPMSPAELAQRLKKTQAAMQQMCKRMADHGLLKKAGYAKYDVPEEEPSQGVSGCQGDATLDPFTT